jgi:Uma2 family endonuclease
MTAYSREEREGRMVRRNLDDAEIVDMAPIGSRRLSCVVALTHLLAERAQDRYFVSVHNPVRLSENDESQPDLTLLRRRPDPAAPSPPEPKEVLAVVEVSDTTLSFERNVKLPLYARVGNSEDWVIDLKAGNVELHSEPAPDGYRESRYFATGERVASGIVEGLSVPVDEVLG